MLKKEKTMKSILIVEDNEVIVKGLRYLLEQEKFKVSVCKNAKKQWMLQENKIQTWLYQI